MSQERRSLTNKDKEEIGLKCANCGAIKDLEYHHIVPLIFGGNDINTNIVCLCSKCHKLIHYDSNGRINHSEAIKKGIQQAREKGVITGRPKITIDKLPPLFIDDIKEGKLNPTELSRKYQIASKTVYKWKQIIEDGE